MNYHLEEITNYLITNEGYILTTDEEIIDYLKEVSRLLKQVRGTSKFASDFKNGNLDEYYEIEDSLKLMTPDNVKLTEEEVYVWLEKNKKK